LGYRAKILQAERRKKELVHFLSRGAAYFHAERKDTASGGEKKIVNLFFIHRYSYLKAKLKDT
jgi:hypothetical protein